MRRPTSSPSFPYTTLFRSNVLIRLREANAAGLAVAKVHVIPGINGGAVLADQRADGVEVEVHVHAIGDRLLEIVFRSEEHTSELQSLRQLVCRLLLEQKKT